MEEVKTVKKRTTKELADEADVTRAAVYQAIKQGYIPATKYGSTYRLTEAAYQYHAENGWGKNVPPYGSDDAE